MIGDLYSKVVALLEFIVQQMSIAFEITLTNLVSTLYTVLLFTFIQNFTKEVQHGYIYLPNHYLDRVQVRKYQNYFLKEFQL
jgi:hypothetical protein